MSAATPQQPGLRAFVVYDRALSYHLPFPVTNDDTAPLLHHGDTVLVDTRQRDPISKELFLIEWLSGQRQIVLCWHPRCKPDHPIAKLFNVGRYKPDPRLAEWCPPNGDEPLRWADGPYSATALAQKLIGRVVGLLEPRFEEPRKLVTEARP